MEPDQMEPAQTDKHFLEAFRDFLTSRTKLELVSLGAIVLLLLDLLIVEIRATTLLLIAVATLPWWLVHLRTYLGEGRAETPAEEGIEAAARDIEPAAKDVAPDFDETDQYGA